MKRSAGVGLVLAAVVALAALLRARVGADSSPAYVVSASWATLPPQSSWGEISAVASDGRGRILVLRRVEPSFLVFTTQGEFVNSWGRGLFRWAHGLRVDREGFVWATDAGDNVIIKFTQGGEELLHVGERGVTGDDRSTTAFDRPTDVAVARSGDFFVSDGYGNSRVVKFGRDGAFRGIIGGTKGSGPGELDLPHALVIDSRERLLVGDRENARIALFDQDGRFLEAWSGLGKPYGLHLAADDTLYVADAEAGTITIAKEGRAVEVIRNLGHPHWLAGDPSGALYTADVRAMQVSKITRN